MRLYSVHVRRPVTDDADLVLIKEGFSWPALAFAVPWALWHRMWLVAAALVAGLALIQTLGAGLGPAAQGLVSLLLGLAAGLFGNDIRRWHKRLGGFRDEGAVQGASLDEAERRFLEGRPEIVRALGGGPAAPVAAP